MEDAVRAEGENQMSQKIGITVEKYDNKGHDPQGQRINGDGCCYPNCDVNVWLRSCEKEIIEPINGIVKGTIPSWINGSLLRNGPGNLKVGDTGFQHLFDGSALLHRFGIANGNVTYQCRFIETETRKKNLAAQRIVVTEFGTCSVPDPCQSIFQKIAAVFKPGESSDNTMISIYPFGDEYYTFTESPIMHRINPKTLATEGRLVVSDFVGVINHTSHPHVMPDGTVYNLGTSITKFGPAYNIICFPKGESMFEDAHIVCTILCRWKLHPGYMHTFGITENYYIIVEQPLSVSVRDYFKMQISNEKLSSCLKWFDDKPTHIYLVDRKTGELRYTFRAEAFFYLHIINQYEEDNHVILDLCSYRDPSMINCMYIESMINMQNNPNYAEMFRGKPIRFVLPLTTTTTKTGNNNKVRRSSITTALTRQGGLTKSFSLANIFPTFQLKTNNLIKRSESEYENVKSSTDFQNNFDIKKMLSKDNLIELTETKSEAYRTADGAIFVQPELLCNMGCETPRINYENYLGKKYRYFYAICSDVDADNPGTLIKVDTVTKTKLTWCEPNCYPSEPVFVPSPKCSSEDDGVILSAMVWGNFNENHAGLLVLCAKTWKELGRCEFKTPGPVPKCLHGWFAPNKDINCNNCKN